MRRRSSRNSQIHVLFGAGIAALLSVYVSAFGLENAPSIDLVEGLTGVPSEIVTSALDNGVVTAMIQGTPAELHRFAKGQSTRFGKLSFDADAYLRGRKGWSEERVHNLGFLYGFSGLRK